MCRLFVEVWHFEKLLQNLNHRFTKITTSELILTHYEISFCIFTGRVQQGSSDKTPKKKRDLWTNTIGYQKPTMQLMHCTLDTMQDFLCELGMKPHMHLVERSIFSLNHVITTPIYVLALRRSLIMLVGLTMKRFIERMPISTRCMCGFMPKLHEKS